MIKNILCFLVFTLLLALTSELVQSFNASGPTEFASFAAITPDQYIKTAGDVLELVNDVTVRSYTFKKKTKIILGIGGAFDQVVIDESHKLDDKVFPSLTTLFFYPGGTLFAAIRPFEDKNYLTHDLIAFDQSKNEIFPKIKVLLPGWEKEAPCKDGSHPWSIGLNVDDADTNFETPTLIPRSSLPSLKDVDYVVFSRYSNDNIRLLRLLKDYLSFPKGTVLSFSFSGYPTVAFTPTSTEISDVKIARNSLVSFYSSGQVYALIPSEAFTIDHFGVDIASVSPVSFHANGHIDTVMIDTALQIGKRSFPAGSYLNFYSTGELAGFTLPNDQRMDGLAVRGKILQCIRQDGSTNFLLTERQDIGGNTYPANSYIIRDSNQNLLRAMLSEDSVINGVKLKAAAVNFSDGKLRGGTLAERKDFGGTPCEAGSPFWLGKDGRAYLCRLSQDLTIESSVFKAGQFFTGSAQFEERFDEPIINAADLKTLTEALNRDVAANLRGVIESYRGKPGVGSMDKIELRQNHYSFSRNSINFLSQFWVENFLDNAIFSDCDCTITVPVTIVWKISEDQKFLAYAKIYSQDLKVSCDGCPFHTLGAAINSLNYRFSGRDGIPRLIKNTNLSPLVNRKVATAFSVLEGNPRVLKCSETIKEFYIQDNSFFATYSLSKRLYDLEFALPEDEPCYLWKEH